ncbi:MAG: hypothetical protein ACTSRI_02655 [Promethearchaeota archaeon]
MLIDEVNLKELKDFVEISVRFPKSFLPTLEIISNLIGKSIEEFFSEIIITNLSALYESPEEIFIFYAKKVKNKFFKEFKKGLDKWLEQQNLE